MADDDSPASRRRARAISHAIDQELKREAQEQRADKSSRILLLGSGDSGKTTVLKQMKILHGGGFTNDDRIKFRDIIARNILDSMRALIEASQTLSIKLTPGCEAHVRVVRDYVPVPSTDSSFALSPQVVEAIKALWVDPAIQECFRKSNQFFIQDTAAHFLNSVDKFVKPGYTPDDQDILYSRQRTSEISEHKFVIEKKIMRVYDVGGQRSDRVTWAPYFESQLDAILFIASLAAYDQMLVEDMAVSRMLDALVLFESIVNHRLLKKISIILFLNKTDLFVQKLNWSPVKRFFPDYTGQNDLKSAGTYFATKFQSQAKDTDRRIYTHFTTASDSKHMNVIIRAVKDTIVRANIAASGL
ncbi:hypothetical protein PhCBS80983_g02655 [Powellomyces hirtus]|uniref:Uncharacterized protein n=1 Tax=Powellomyces hirtus TaxID=109895 RepID=A0A507E5L7_9FUNG|nr:guanine nucleotide-binding protein alpha subunit [Powellomyces hirtus]KAI8910551.1 guanine nucleotide-binding protein alpha subunit [Powellomyces hirtus]TPX59152.1 hypothetical protein PhCBS80983_g02655 [Powellomyces hirtus]